MILIDGNKNMLMITGNAVDILSEVGMIVSEVEEKFAQKFGPEMTKDMIDYAVEAGREANRTVFFHGQNPNHGSVL